MSREKTTIFEPKLRDLYPKQVVTYICTSCMRKQEVHVTGDITCAFCKRTSMKELVIYEIENRFTQFKDIAVALDRLEEYLQFFLKQAVTERNDRQRNFFELRLAALYLLRTGETHYTKGEK